MSALRSWYDQAFRNFKTKADQQTPPEVGGPVGAGTNMTAADQAEALRGVLPRHAQAEERPSAWTGLDRKTQGEIQGAYQTGGFEGVVKAAGPSWYDLPEHVRTQILIGMRGGG